MRGLPAPAVGRSRRAPPLCAPESPKEPLFELVLRGFRHSLLGVSSGPLCVGLRRIPPLTNTKLHRRPTPPNPPGPPAGLRSSPLLPDLHGRAPGTSRYRLKCRDLRRHSLSRETASPPLSRPTSGHTGGYPRVASTSPRPLPRRGCSTRCVSLQLTQSAFRSDSSWGSWFRVSTCTLFPDPRPAPRPRSSGPVQVGARTRQSEETIGPSDQRSSGTITS